MPERMILDDELRSDRRAKTQREWRGTIQFFIRERAYRGARLPAVLTHEFKGGSSPGHFPVRDGDFCNRRADVYKLLMLGGIPAQMLSG